MDREGQMTMTALRGPASTAFFIFNGEAISVQVSVPSLPRSSPNESADNAARLAAAHALMQAAALLVRAT